MLLELLRITTYVEGHLDKGMTKPQELTAPAMQNEIPPLLLQENCRYFVWSNTSWSYFSVAG